MNFLARLFFLLCAMHLRHARCDFDPPPSPSIAPRGCSVCAGVSICAFATLHPSSWTWTLWLPPTLTVMVIGAGGFAAWSPFRSLHTLCNALQPVTCTSVLVVWTISKKWLLYPSQFWSMDPVLDSKELELLTLLRASPLSSPWSGSATW